MSCDAWRQWLDAYVDDECTPEQVEGIEDHLRSCPACTAESLARLQLKRATRAAAAGHFTPPADLRPIVEKSIRKPNSWRWGLGWVPALGALAALLLVVAASAWVYVRHTAREQALAELVDMHVATTASANPVDVVSTDRHTVKPWFAGKLPFTFNLPELQGTPFILVGGRLVYFEHSPGAELLFNLRKHQISVFILEDAGGAAKLGSRETTPANFSVESWSQSGLRYVAIGDTNPGDIRALSDLLRAAGR